MVNSNFLVPTFIFAGLVVFLFVYNEYQRMKIRRTVRREVELDFGKNTQKKIPLKNIDGYYRVFGGKIDDITFHDLELFSFLTRYNHRKSRPGDEIFYHRLRNPLRDGEELVKLQKQRGQMLKDPEKMKEFQFELALLGRSNATVIHLLQEGIELNGAYRIPVYVLSFSILYILLLIYFLHQVAVFPIIGLLIVNGSLYRVLKRETEGHLLDLIYLRQIVHTGEKLSKLSAEFFKEEQGTLKEIMAKIAPLKRALGGFAMPGSSGMVEMEVSKEYFNVLTMSEARRLFKSQKYIDEFSEELFQLYYLIGDMDTKLSLASIAYGYDTVEVSFEEGALRGKKVNNPLLFEDSVPNSFDLTHRCILLTGSNASGKSTFLRTLGLNQVLALTAGLAFAQEYVTDFYGVISEIDISDSLSEGLSYFMAETVAIKRMIDEEQRHLLLLDEIFRGTNTIDRISAATLTLRYLAKRHCVIAATHDIELTQFLEGDFENYHFEEEIINQDIVFDYRLKEGPAKSRNAIAILESKKYPDVIIEGAYALAKKMEEKK